MDEGRLFLVDINSSLVGVVLPTLISINKAELVDHIKQEGQKVYDANVPTHLWSFFFRESFIHYFGSVSGTTVERRKGHPNVYRWHDWKCRAGLPKDWEAVMDGFRQLGIRWWSRNLLQIYAA